jgi:predicted aminopeptidase
VLALTALSLAASCIACSPVYVVKAGVAEMRILRAREPIHRVLNDSTTPADTRAKLSYVLEARRFAAEELGIDVGESYTQFTQLDRDTLALVVTAAPKDQLAPLTWWFPIVGRVPYRGFFSVQDALEAAADLEADGYDTSVRPTAAFSTLGWFNDPLLSTALDTDDVEVVTTVLHELSHQHLFVPGHVDFNESFANFAGRVAAIQFFCTREGGGPDTVRCQRAQARWRDYQGSARASWRDVPAADCAGSRHWRTPSGRSGPSPPRPRSPMRRCARPLRASPPLSRSTRPPARSTRRPGSRPTVRFLLSGRTSDGIMRSTSSSGPMPQTWRGRALS